MTKASASLLVDVFRCTESGSLADIKAMLLGQVFHVTSQEN